MTYILYVGMLSLNLTQPKLLECCCVSHYFPSLFAAGSPWSVAGSIAGLLPGAAVDRESPFAGVTAVRFPHTLFIQ